ncbi:MAG: hypothetical protein IMZ43_12300 [Thermoplasmata archaeon]|nr:hypothetical protein [Thermoplasmata archaeon]
MNHYKIARDSYGVCMECWKLTTTTVLGQDHNPPRFTPIEVTACCLSEDMIPYVYAGKCDTCGGWLDIRFAYPKEMEEYRCEKCETKES